MCRLNSSVSAKNVGIDRSSIRKFIGNDSSMLCLHGIASLFQMMRPVA